MQEGHLRLLGRWFLSLKKEGGLGIIDIETQNRALLLKNLDKFYNRRDIPWVQIIWEKYYSRGRLPESSARGSFWWRNILTNIQYFKDVATPRLKDGMSILFWQDKWNGSGQCLRLAAPELYSFAKNKKISVQRFRETQGNSGLFHLPLSEQAHLQLQQVMQNL
jgi:hypothetical protein